MRYPFLKNAARILNAGQSRSLLLHGNVHDLFFAATKKSSLPDGQTGDALDGSYQPLGRVLVEEWSVPGLVMLVYELNGPIRFPTEEVREKVKRAWISWRAGLSADELALQGLLDPRSKREADDLASEYERQLLEVIGNPTVALEFLRQLCLCSRTKTRTGESLLPEDLLILVEEADLLLPEGNIATLSRADRHRVGIVFDWFSDPEFQSGGDSVVLVAESPSLVHQRVTRLPYVLTVEVPAPDEQARAHFLAWFARNQPKDRPLKLWANDEGVVRATAGLSLHAFRQLLLGAQHGGGELGAADVVDKVAEYIQRQLGEDVVEFKRPTHTLADVIGFTRLKSFLEDELVPRLRSTGKDALTGAAVSGPIGGGKSFIFEAVASELDFPVLVLKNIRSQWFGQTDVIFERLRRTLLALGKVMIFVDEADTQFGGVGPDAHETERRLTGKIQAMISDPELRGRVVWLLMTARIHQLSPDLRRPGRVGDLIIPVLDPEGEDRLEFLSWVLKGCGLDAQPKAADSTMKELDRLTRGWSAASFASLRATLAAAAVRGPLTTERLVAIVADQISPSIERTRRYQTLQALANCTRRSLLPDPKVSDADREAWQREILQLEREGIH
jgi:hypothetical protein